MVNLISNPRKFGIDVMAMIFCANGIIIPLGRNWTPIQLISIFIVSLILIELIVGQRKKIVFDKKSFIYFVLFLAACIISIIFKPPSPEIVFASDSKYNHSYSTLSWLYFAWMTLNFLIVITIYLVIDAEKALFRFLRIVFLSSVFYSLYSLYQYIIVSIFGLGAQKLVYVLNYTYLWGPEAIRSPSLSREPLFYSFYLLFIILLLINVLSSDDGSFMKKLQLSKYSIIAILLLNLLAFFLGKPTAGFFAIVCGLIFMFRKQFKFSRKISIKNAFRIFIGAVTSVGVLSLFLFINYERVFRRVIRFTDVSSGYVRVTSILESLEYIKKDPWTGYGLSNSQFFIKTIVIHNMYLNLLAELGIIGFVIFLAFIYYVWKKLIKLSNSKFLEYKIMGNAFAAYYVTILIQWLSFHAFSIPVFWVLTGVILVVDKLHHRTTTELKPI